jgi:hypothetical protein
VRHARMLTHCVARGTRVGLVIVPALPTHGMATGHEGDGLDNQVEANLAVEFFQARGTLNGGSFATGTGTCCCSSSRSGSSI